MARDDSAVMGWSCWNKECDRCHGDGQKSPARGFVKWESPSAAATTTPLPSTSAICGWVQGLEHKQLLILLVLRLSQVTS